MGVGVVPRFVRGLARGGSGRGRAGGAAGEERIGGGVGRALVRRSRRRDGNGNKTGTGTGTGCRGGGLLDHVGYFVRQQPQACPGVRSERPVGEVDVRAHGEGPSVQRPAGRVGAGVVQPNRGEVDGVSPGPEMRLEKIG